MATERPRQSSDWSSNNQWPRQPSEQSGHRKARIDVVIVLTREICQVQLSVIHSVTLVKAAPVSRRKSEVQNFTHQDCKKNYWGKAMAKKEAPIAARRLGLDQSPLARLVPCAAGYLGGGAGRQRGDGALAQTDSYDGRLIPKSVISDHQPLAAIRRRWLLFAMDLVKERNEKKELLVNVKKTKIVNIDRCSSVANVIVNGENVEHFE
ncbi:hypothetical protein EGW08_021262 [Elysia chlorotica]|uniref:Uncharacterized protein n=1 Tax=Elysia chlorotica TaxID=188477 RepID=A0A3S0ZMN1_ELYCH|nr:hypothetical protein EGW08_021262 [Elysia chlorotica]